MTKDMKKNIEYFILTICVVVYTITMWLWLNVDAEIALGHGMSLFLSCFSSYDHFVFSGIMIYIFGIFFILGYLILISALFPPGSTQPIIVNSLLLWMIVFPIFILLGVSLFKVRVLSSRTDWIYLLIASYMVEGFFLWKKNLSLLSPKLWIFVIVAYLVSFAALCLPKEQLIKIFRTERTNYVFKIDELDCLVSMTTRNDTVTVKIGKDLQSQDSTFVFVYYPINREERIDDQGILLLQYDNQMMFWNHNGLEIEVVNWAFYKEANKDPLTPFRGE